MSFSYLSVIDAINALAASAKPEERAVGHNLRWDERIGPDRAAAFEQPRFRPDGFGDKVLVGRRFRQGYARYFEDRVRWTETDGLPDTFLPVNQHAAFAHLPDDNRVLVRLLGISWYPEATGTGFERLESAIKISVAAGQEDESDPVKQARATVQELVTPINAYDRKPPSFVGFESDVKAELADPDWPHALRDRFGIGHLAVPRGGTPIPVGLLRYTVRQVLQAAVKHGPPGDAIRVPTVLESNLYPYFYPSPTPLPYGRTVHLKGGTDAEKLTCELVHLPIPLQMRHIVRCGQVTKPRPRPSLVLRFRGSHHLAARP